MTSWGLSFRICYVVQTDRKYSSTDQEGRHFVVSKLYLISPFCPRFRDLLPSGRLGNPHVTSQTSSTPSVLVWFRKPYIHSDIPSTLQAHTFIFILHLGC